MASPDRATSSHAWKIKRPALSVITMTLVAIVILCTFEFVSPAPLASGQQDAPRPALGVNSITLREPATRNRDLDLIKKDRLTNLRVQDECPIV